MKENYNDQLARTALKSETYQLPISNVINFLFNLPSITILSLI